MILNTERLIFNVGNLCGTCRKLMVQFMPERYKEIEIMMDYEQERIATLGELTPEWWI